MAIAVDRSNPTTMLPNFCYFHFFLDVDHTHTATLLANGQVLSPLNAADVAFNELFCFAFSAGPDIGGII